MDEPVYDVKVLEDGTRFDFLSIGYIATHKAILYQETEIPFLYSLTLAEVQRDGRLSTTVNNSNADVKPTMATISKTIEAFTAANPKGYHRIYGKYRCKNPTVQNRNLPGSR